MAGQRTCPSEIAGLMIRDYENPFISLNFWPAVKPLFLRGVVRRGRFDDPPSHVCDRLFEEELQPTVHWSSTNASEEVRCHPDGQTVDLVKWSKLVAGRGEIKHYEWWCHNLRYLRVDEQQRRQQQQQQQQQLQQQQQQLKTCCWWELQDTQTVAMFSSLKLFPMQLCAIPWGFAWYHLKTFYLTCWIWSYFLQGCSSSLTPVSRWYDRFAYIYMIILLGTLYSMRCSPFCSTSFYLYICSIFCAQDGGGVSFDLLETLGCRQHALCLGPWATSVDACYRQYTNRGFSQGFTGGLSVVTLVRKKQAAV